MGHRTPLKGGVSCPIPVHGTCPIDVLSCPICPIAHWNDLERFGTILKELLNWLRNPPPPEQSPRCPRPDVAAGDVDHEKLLDVRPACAGAVGVSTTTSKSERGAADEAGGAGRGGSNARSSQVRFAPLKHPRNRPVAPGALWLPLEPNYGPFVGRFCSEFTFLAKIDCGAVQSWSALDFSKCPPRPIETRRCDLLGIGRSCWGHS